MINKTTTTEHDGSSTEHDGASSEKEASTQSEQHPQKMHSLEEKQYIQDRQILAARQKRRIWVFALSGIGAAIVLGYLIWLFLAKGYQIMVNPEPAKMSSQVTLISGAGFVISNKVYAFSTNTVVAVSAAKFVTQEVVLNSDSPAIIDVTLLPAPVKLTDLLSSLPTQTVTT